MCHCTITSVCVNPLVTMALIQFGLTHGRRHCMLILLGAAWAILNANPFSIATLVPPGTIMPVVALFFCMVAWATFASTRLCQHGVGKVAILVWTVNIYLFLHLVVYGFAPAFGVVALFTVPMRTITSGKKHLTTVLAYVSVGLIAIACILIADPRHLLSPGGYRTFDGIESENSAGERGLVYAAVPCFVASLYFFPPRSDPVQTIAYSGAIVLAGTTTLGFMASMTVLDSSGSLANLDFYHCGFVFVWSVLLFVVMLLLCSFHVIGLATDAYVTMSITTVTVCVMQWILKREAPHQPQEAGLALMALGVLLFHWFQKLDMTATYRELSAFFTCQACEQERDIQTVEALDDASVP
jgi:hypothetical protein